jgi:hypothetical protein
MSNDNNTTNQIKVSLSLTASPNTPRKEITVEVLSTTPSELHRLASTETKIPPETLKLIFRGRLIPKDDVEKKVVEAFNLEDGCVIHCMGKPTVSTAVDSQVASTTTSTPTITQPSIIPASVIPPAATTQSSNTSIPANTNNINHGSNSNALSQALQSMKTNHDATTYKTAVQTLSKIINNIVQNPMEEKYRKMKKNNAAYQKRLGSLSNAHDVMISIGFQLQNPNAEEAEYVLVPSPTAWPNVIASKAIVDRELEEVGRGFSTVTQQQSRSSGTPSGTSSFGLNNTTSLGGMPAIPPGMESTMANMLNDPNMLQSMLQNPMVRQMIQNDPRFASNPMLQQSFQQLSQNPQLLEQMSRMMSDPTMRNQVMSRMGANAGDPMNMMMGGGAGGFGGNSFGSSGGGASLMNNTQQQQNNNSTTNTTGNSNSSNNNNSGDDREMTEEEMIAEAIARSLRET